MLSNAHRLKRTGLCLLLAALGLFWGTAASSYGHLRGYSLTELINDQIDFHSGNGEVLFGDFDLASIPPIEPSLLEQYRVVPNELGFWLYSPDFMYTDPGDIAFTYSAQASEGLEIDTIRFSYSSAQESIMAYGEMQVTDTDGTVLADLNVAVGGSMYSSFRSGKSGGKNDHYDADTASFPPEHSLLIDELTSGGMPPASWRTGHKFFTTPIPEPETALMLGLGLAGLAISGRRPRR